jgi:hypothetical protein
MSNSYVFLDEDEFNPIYCVECRLHIPRAYSDANRGLCADCLEAQEKAAANALAQKQAALNQQAAQDAQRQQLVYSTNTGRGKCPQCSSVNIAETQERVSNSSGGTMKATGCVLIVVSIICFWPLAIVGIVLCVLGMFTPSTAVVGTSRSCQACGYRWKV